MLDIPETERAGTTPSGFTNGSLGLMSGLLILAVRPTGLVRIALCEKLKPASLITDGRKMLMLCAATPRPGELVMVAPPCGTLEPRNRPLGSRVGISSIVIRPQTLNRELKL